MTEQTRSGEPVDPSPHAWSPSGHRPPSHPTGAGDSSQAAVALALGILSMTCFGFLTGIPAMLIGRGATAEIDRSNGALGGRAMARAGFVTGLIGSVLSVVAIVVVVILFLAVGTGVRDTYHDISHDTSNDPCESLGVQRPDATPNC